MDLSKYGVTEIPQEQSNINDNGMIDLSKYNVTPDIALPTKPKQTLGSKIKSKLGEIGTNIKNVGKSSITFNAQGKPTLSKEAQQYAMDAVSGFAGGSGVVKAIKPTTVNILKNTTETLSKLEENAANLEGRIKTTIAGAKKVLPSKTEKRAAQLLEGQVSTNVTKNPIIIKSEISRRGSDVENYVSKNAKKITAEEQMNMFSSKRAKLADYMDKTQLKAYDAQVSMFQKILNKTAKGKGFNTDSFYKAVKEYEDNVASNLPKGKALLFDTTGVGSAKILGARSVRNVVRDII